VLAAKRAAPFLIQACNADGRQTVPAHPRHLRRVRRHDDLQKAAEVRSFLKKKHKAL
jgi:hypothetical protein